MFKKFSAPVATLAIFLLMGVLLAETLDSQRHVRCHSSHPFVNAEALCDRPPAIEKTGYASTQGKIERFIESEKVLGHTTEVAVYFRDLKDGPVFGINENIDFAPASLLKLPLALVYLTQSERNPDMLKEHISVEKPQWEVAVRFPQTERVINPSEPHTVEELLMHMLKHSDNDAYGVLQTHLYDIGEEGLITQTFIDLGFIDPATTDQEMMGVRRYAGIFRALYNSSYMNTELSEEVLGWLVDSGFKQGLVGGVPEDVVVAHKFGARVITADTKQLHDCGIIYYPLNPYLLCVMTKGADFEILAKVIRHISEEIYTEVNSRRL